VKKTENVATTYYLRSTVLGGQVVAEIDGGGAWQRGYVYLGSQTIAIQHAGVNWVHRDAVTKSQRVTNSSGTVTSTIDLDPWGGETNRSANSAFQPHKYTTYERDANGGDEAMMRSYTAKWHRFSQPDPYDGSYNATDPQSFNRYAYTQNDPVNFVDPSGLNARPNWLDDRWALFNAGCVNLSGDGGSVIICNDVGGPNGAISFGGGWGPSPMTDDEEQPQKTTPVDKGDAWWGDCNRSANDLMRTVRRDFSKFGNFSEPVAGGLGVAGIKFDSGPITQGRTIGITVGGFSTVDPSISYSRSMSVTVSSASTQSFTFTTNPGHVFYPGTISFSARDTNSGVRFGIDLKGQYGDTQSEIGFKLGGGSFEDNAWKSFLAKVRESCGHRN
jgi:RHS repeat-associated protein